MRSSPSSVVSKFSRGLNRRARSAYTLVEVLVVVVVLGIAAAMVVPEFSSTSVLRVQAAVRMVVADIIEAQSDAIAYQQSRGLKFFANQRRYQVAACRGGNCDFTLDLLEDRQFGGEDFGNASITAVSFAGSDTLYFDELGSPVTAPGSGLAAPSGYVEITGSGQRFRVTVEAYTGRCTVTTVP